MRAHEPMNVGVTFQYEPRNLAELVLNTRAVRALDSAAMRYPIHRDIRCAARRKLEETDDRLETIAYDCGFGTEDQMRSAFLRTVKVPPRDYRKRFA